MHLLVVDAVAVIVRELAARMESTGAIGGRSVLGRLVAAIPVERTIPQLVRLVFPGFAASMIVTDVPSVSVWPMQTMMGN